MRAASSLEVRTRILRAAVEVLDTAASASDFTLETVAGKASVARLTIYNQFGSRSALMESAYDYIEEGSGCSNLADACPGNGGDALEFAVRTYCRAWASPAVARIHDAAGSDVGLAQALILRHERRKKVLKAIVKGTSRKTSKKLMSEIVDVLFALTGPQFFRAVADGRSERAGTRLVWEACSRAYEHTA